MTEYESESTGDRAAIAAEISAVVDGIYAGTIALHDGTEGVTATVPAQLDLETELDVEDDEVSLELELTWPLTDGESPTFSAPPESEDESTAPSHPGSAATPSAEQADRSVAAEAPEPAEGAPPPQSLARFEVYRDRGDQWRWRLRHRNGNIIATGGQGYTQKHNAWKGLRSVVGNAPGAAVTEEETE